MLNPGDKAPAFRGIDQQGELIALKDFKGRKLALYFYPADDTPTCTVQACNLRDNMAELTRLGFTVVGVSPDGAAKHKKFETKYNLNFRLIADTDTRIAQAFGVWGPKKFMGRDYIGLHRTTFLINEKGKIEHIIRKPKSKDHAAEIMAAWKSK